MLSVLRFKSSKENGGMLVYPRARNLGIDLELASIIMKTSTENVGFLFSTFLHLKQIENSKLILFYKLEIT